MFQRLAAMPRWLLLTLLSFIDGDMETTWSLLEAVGWDIGSALSEDDATAYFLIQ